MPNHKYTVKATVTLNFEVNARSPDDAYNKYIKHFMDNTAWGDIEFDDDSNIIVLNAEGKKVLDESQPIPASDDFTGYKGFDGYNNRK